VALRLFENVIFQEVLCNKPLGTRIELDSWTGYVVRWRGNKNKNHNMIEVVIIQFN
jgi:hypothetical protein